MITWNIENKHRLVFSAMQFQSEELTSHRAVETRIWLVQLRTLTVMVLHASPILHVQSRISFRNFCWFSILELFMTDWSHLWISIRIAKTVSLKAHKNISSHYNTFNKHKLKKRQSRERKLTELGLSPRHFLNHYTRHWFPSSISLTQSNASTLP